MPFLSSCSVSLFARFLESQLRSQRSQWEEEVEALRLQLGQASSGSSSAAQQEVSSSRRCCLCCVRDAVEKTVHALNDQFQISHSFKLEIQSATVCVCVCRNF